MSQFNADTARKLASYTATATLGAFAVGNQADAAIIYTNVSPDLNVGANDNATINLDNSGYAEVAIVNIGANLQVRDAYDGNILTSSGSYYVQGFNFGDEIGPGANEASDAGAHVAANGAYNFFDNAMKYIGVEFDLGGQTHYGWVGFEVDSTSPMNGVIRDYAYETTPNTPINAGAGVIPEPASLALLAAGAGALAAPRRKCA